MSFWTEDWDVITDLNPRYLVLAPTYIYILEFSKIFSHPSMSVSHVIELSDALLT